MKYKFLEHTADAKFQAFGKSLEEAFSNAALAVMSIMIDPKKVNPKITKEVNVKGNDKESLLYNFLEELLILLDTENFILNNVKELKIKGNSLKANLIGDELNNKYELKSDVKAITYNEMFIKENPFIVQVVCDI